MASLTENYNELQFTPKSWEFVSSMENFPFDKLPQKEVVQEEFGP